MKRSVSAMQLGLGLLLAGIAMQAAAVERAAADARAQYEAGNFAGALETYSQLADENPENAALEFNRGAARYQLGELDLARESFERAGLLTEDVSLQARCAYNMGNCAYQQAQAPKMVGMA